MGLVGQEGWQGTRRQSTPGGSQGGAVEAHRSNRRAGAAAPPPAGTLSVLRGPLTPIEVGNVLWFGFVASWYAAAVFWAGRAVARNGLLSRMRDDFLFAVAFVLLFVPRATVPGFWDTPAPVAYGLLGMQTFGFAFAWWARVYLGKLWSGAITLREGHRVVQQGPYGLVRHPIYTGFLIAAWAFALLAASPTALAGAAVLTLHMAWKATREERFLRQELGAAEYDAYAQRTPMLVPFARPARAPRGGPAG